jgi:hypothetical protein
VPPEAGIAAFTRSTFVSQPAARQMSGRRAVKRKIGNIDIGLSFGKFVHRPIDAVNALPAGLAPGAGTIARNSW